MPVRIRRALPSDSASVSHICLVTGDAGTSAEHLHNIPEALGYVYAEPYVNFSTTFGFVLEDDESKEILGYILGTTDTVEFETVLEKYWWPPLRERYPLDIAGSSDQRTEADQKLIKLFHNPDKADKACLAFSPAHFHIDLKPQCQRQGWGRKLVDRAVQFLSEQGLDAVWLGLDPRNDNAKRFYERLNFKSMPGFPDNCLGLRFENWKK